ncbi:MAG: response regulator transcription factor [Oscillospiraceae bacterium]|nr:response regulator transcription factor [Oscillospiraceae bacterium]
MNPILAVDTSLDIHKQQTAQWTKYGVDTLRVDTMQEAIVQLSGDEDFLFVVINEDSVPDYLRKLRIIRYVTNIPIFVLTSNYEIDKKIKAMNHGADVYDTFAAYEKRAILSILDLLKSQSRRPILNPLPLLDAKDLVLSRSCRSVFINNIEVPLTKKEFEILQMLMAETGHPIPHLKLLQKVWGNEYGISDIDVLWRTVYRLRGKLAQATPGIQHISIVRGVGYRFM